MFATGSSFPVPQILEFKAFHDSETFSSNFPGTFLQNFREDPGNSHSLLELSDSSRDESGDRILRQHVREEVCDNT